MSTTQRIWETQSAAETRALAVRLAAFLAAGDVIALAGDLGAGKTTFTQGLAHGLGITAAVTSPTFVLINRYRTPDGRALQHADCYRLQDAPLEMWDAGLGDLFAGDDIVVIEWADRIPGLLPADHLEIFFEYLADEQRRLTLRAHGARWDKILTGL